MSSPSNGKLIVIAGVLVLGAVAVFLWFRSGTGRPATNSKAETAQGTPATVTSSQTPAAQTSPMVAALAYLDLNGDTLPAEKTIDDYARELGNDPDHIMQEVEKRTSLFP